MSYFRFMLENSDPDIAIEHVGDNLEQAVNQLRLAVREAYGRAYDDTNPDAVFRIIDKLEALTEEIEGMM